jgi:hypothetical protein
LGFVTKQSTPIHRIDIAEAVKNISKNLLKYSRKVYEIFGFRDITFYTEAAFTAVSGTADYNNLKIKKQKLFMF